MGECRCCHSDKKIPKKFSADNNMDPGEVSDELQERTDIKEMLIAQVFTVMSVYRLQGRQNGYKGNVINFLQDVREFTRHLPRNPASLDVLVVRRESANDPSEFRDFTVQREKIAKVLFWLKANNPYYEDIIIDDEILNSLPQNGSIINQIQQIRSDQIIDEMDDISNENEIRHDEGNAITHSFVPAIPSMQGENAMINDTLDRMQSNQQSILWPEIDRSLINEFQTPGYIARAFLTLYPYGKSDLRFSRPREIKPAEALQERKAYVQQNLSEKHLDISDIQEMISNGDKQLADRIMRYRESLQGTRQFWIARRGELLDIIKQIGHRGLIFFTFSAADFHWPNLHRLMPDDEDAQSRVINNPHIAAWFFTKRFESFFNNMLKEKWDLEDWWFQYEWQYRGSVHVHGIRKKRIAPNIEWKELKNNKEEMKNVIDYIDSIVTTVNPAMHAHIPEKHLCQKDKNGQPELYTARNDPYINPHNRIQLQGWRANVDLKPILSIHAALQYISKYASKAEPSSQAFSEIFEQILNNSNPDDSSLTLIQKLLLNSVSERDISAQETCHLLNGIALYHSSRSFIFLNVNEEGLRWIQSTDSQDNVEDTGRTT
ncbi:hypothetical protein RclHR1_14780007 [Rhizophagus clarus]|uniref:Uncharacterized protein n=1 Tax=Rhizophagus clarus TaxID=94130 RepID=A0A2Z6QDE6_9GLOM|nr:hypothetical protein RclHR1_14780007 [Rhizophagus clarus]